MSTVTFVLLIALHCIILELLLRMTSSIIACLKAIRQLFKWSKTKLFFESRLTTIQRKCSSSSNQLSPTKVTLQSVWRLCGKKKLEEDMMWISVIGDCVGRKALPLLLWPTASSSNQLIKTKTLDKISQIQSISTINITNVQTRKCVQHSPKQFHTHTHKHSQRKHPQSSVQTAEPQTLLTLLWTLKSDRDAMSSSSSRVAEEADILACCCAGVSSWPSVCSSDTTKGVGLHKKGRK